LFIINDLEREMGTEKLQVLFCMGMREEKRERDVLLYWEREREIERS
jgi:hypothetical protein